MKSKILVTGATGQLGGSVIKHLLKKIPADQIIAMVRDESKAKTLKDAGITVRTGDYHNVESLKTAFAGVNKAILVSSNDFHDRLRQHKNVTDAAKAAGVSHLVYTGISLRDIHSSALRDFMMDHFQLEDYIRASGLAYTFMQHNLYAEMIPFYIGTQVLDKGIIFPAGDGRVSFALRDEMGEANAIVLTTDGHRNKTYNIGSPASYSFADLAAMLSAISGRAIDYTSSDPDDYIDNLKAKGLPEMTIKVVTGFSAAMRNGDFDVPVDDLANLLGRKPAGLSGFLKSVYGA